MTTGAPDLSKHGREFSRQEILVPNFSAESKHGPCLFEGSERQAKRMISYRLCNSIKLLQTHSKKNVLLRCFQPNQIKQTSSTKIVLATAIPLTETHLKEFQRQKTSCQTAPRPQLRDFLKHFSTMPGAALHGSLSAWLMIKKDNDTEISGEKHDKQWLLKMCCVVRFQKK